VCISLWTGAVKIWTSDSVVGPNGIWDVLSMRVYVAYESVVGKAVM